MQEEAAQTWQHTRSERLEEIVGESPAVAQCANPEGVKSTAHLEYHGLAKQPDMLLG